MLVGHYGASFLAKSWKRDVPLWAFVLAAQVVDFVWAGLLMVGAETATLSERGTGLGAFRFDPMPYSHSLVAAALWAGVVVVIAKFVPRRRKTPPGALAVLAAVVVSHWFLDWLVHRQDLLVLDGPPVGLGLWDTGNPLAFWLEILLLGIGLVVYQLRCSVPVGRLVAFGVTLFAVQVMMSFLPPKAALDVVYSALSYSPLSGAAAAKVLAVLAVLFYLAVTWWANELQPPNALNRRGATMTKLRVASVIVVFLALALLALGIWHVIDAVGLGKLGQNAIIGSPAILLWVTFLLTLGITLVGYAEVLSEARDNAAGKAAGTAAGTVQYGRFWFLGCDTFANGIRVVFLIPISLACWMGLVAAFHVVWRYAPSQQLEGAATGREILTLTFDPQPTTLPKDSLPPDPARTTAWVQPGIPDSTTTIVIWVLDASKKQRKVAADGGRLLVRVQTTRLQDSALTTTAETKDAVKVRRPVIETLQVEQEPNKTFVARYTPIYAGVDRVWIELDGVAIGRGEAFESRVAIPSARPLTQRQNLWFLPLGILIAWMLLWPSEPEDKTKTAEQRRRTAGTDALDRLAGQIRKQVRAEAIAALEAAKIPADSTDARLDQLEVELSDTVMERMGTDAVKLLAPTIPPAAVKKFS